MKTVKRISSESEGICIQIKQSADGTYNLEKYLSKYDPEEEVSYEVKVTPNPSGIFDTLESAEEEAKRVLDL
ncbi:hypothetical protein N473_07505 [Pseudoalteromonas luteoviolacea CPMOR-1]|uniref:Uncharacterized protein n=1 Tax=Pseudoalteromonas luteoviolacea CPMOR-1 TaxID=1365248 RepID=A0A162B8F4_9GAMM|nr:hypothetical protein [Pseudoalteromonas luteoviolacea]KZN68263.1 hypothetical protein N473_07505 [Pseudoalteromonas luteoviolacea CPMOR-1]